MDVQLVMRRGWGGCGGDADDGLVDRTDRGGGGDGRDGDRNRLSWWEDNIGILTLGTEPNDTLPYDLGLEHHHPIMITLWDTGGQSESERDIL